MRPAGHSCPSSTRRRVAANASGSPVCPYSPPRKPAWPLGKTTGAVYPTLSQLEDEGLVTVTADAGRKLATLTDAGRSAVEDLRGTGNDPFAGAADGAPAPDVRGLLEQLHGAVRQVARTGTEAQLTAAAEVLAQARRALYLLLAEGPDAPVTPPPAD